MDYRRRSAVVIGGGPAGCSAALGLLRAGIPTTVLEQRSRWTGRVCGAFLNAEAVDHLHRMGTQEAILRAGAVRVAKARLTSPSGAETLVRIPAGLAVPRKTLEEALLDAVEKAGGRVDMGVRGTKESFGDDLIILANGRFSLQSSSPRVLQSSHQCWFGWNASFEGADQEPGGMSLHFYPGGYVGVATFPGGLSNVCGLWRRDGDFSSWETVFQEALEKQPALRRLLRGARRQEDWRGVGPLPFSSRLREAQGTFPVGDAAAVGDPFMGEGLGRALAAGSLLAESLSAAHPLAAYRRLWNRRYAARLRAGSLLRLGLACPAPLQEAFLRRDRILAALAARLHSAN